MVARGAGRLFTQTLVVLCLCGLRDVPDSSREGAIKFMKPCHIFKNRCHVLTNAFTIFIKPCHVSINAFRIFIKPCHVSINAFRIFIKPCYLFKKHSHGLKNAFDLLIMPFRLFYIASALF